MSMLSHRLQVLIEPAQYERLRRESERRGEPIGAIVRDAIDRAVAPDIERRRAAWEHLMSLGPLPVPDDPAELEREIQEMYGRMPEE